MTTRQHGTVLHYLRSLVDAETTKDLSDTQLLQRFAACREEAAFAALVQRHGPLVWGICQHLLHHEQDAEDAFQATFLVLARRASAIRKTEAISSFLHGVAYRIALRAKRRARQRQARENRANCPHPSNPPDDLAWRELQAMLDEEVARLPAKYRSPFILCCLEGKSRTEAVRELRCNEGTISSRIARARQMLQQRLARRGVTLSAALCATILWKQTASATVPGLLASNTIQAAAGFPDRLSAAATTLAESALRAMGFGRWHLGGLLLLSLTLLAVGAGVSRFMAVAPHEAAPIQSSEPPAEMRKDLHGDPLPPGALARLGTVRQRAPESHVAVTGDGKEIITLSGGLTVRRFDARTGALRSIRRVSRASGAFRYGAWLSPHGKFAMAAGTSGPSLYQLDLWDIAAGRHRQTLSLAGHFPRGAAFSADERHVAVAESPSQREDELRVVVWDLDTAKSRVLWSERKDIQQQFFEPVVVFSPDGKRLVSCHLDQILRCWEVESGKLLWQSEKKTYSPLLVFSADSKTLIVPSSIGTSGIDIRNAATGKLLESKKLSEEAIFPIGSSPDGRFLAFQTGKEEVVLWEPGKEKIAFRFPRPLHRRDDPTHFVLNYLPTNFAFTPDGKGFIRRAGALQGWDLTTGKPMYPDTEDWGHTEEVTRLLFSPDGRLLASSSRDQTVRLWDVGTARSIHTIPKGQSDHLAFTLDGRFLLTVPHGLGKTVLHATDVATGRADRGFELADRSEFMAGSRDKEIRFTPDGKKVRILTWKNGRRNDECMLTAWETATGKCLVHKRVPWGEESLLTPNGQSVLAPDNKTGAIRLLELETAKQRWQLNEEPPHGMRQPVYACDLALSPNGQMIAARSRFVNIFTFREEFGAIRLADMVTARQLAKFSIDGPAVFAFSEDNRLFAVAGADGIRLWETATWKEIGSIPVPNRDFQPQDRSCASSVAFAPDGRVLATGHADGTILLWDATLRRGTRACPLSAAERETLWNDLAGTDAAKAYVAVWRLADDLASSVPFLKDLLKPITPIPPDVLRSLLEDLDSDRFEVREMADRKLRAFGERAASPLRAELHAKPSLEKRKRIEKVLAELEESSLVSGEPLRELRAVQVLERVGSAEARQLLERLSRGVESARLTQAANEALTRLRKR